VRIDAGNDAFHDAGEGVAIAEVCSQCDQHKKDFD
jgi:hypothetical protein